MLTNQCGIYKITNIITGDFYIGSAVNIPNRWSRHRNALGGNYHENEHLQRAWNKYGAQAFEFSALELCEAGQLIEREQSYIDSEKPSYNICQTAGSQLGTKRSAEALAKMSGENHPMFGKPGTMLGKHHTAETKRKQSEAKMGERSYSFGKHFSEEHKQKLSESLHQYWELKRNLITGAQQPRLEIL